jgi:hypothetical protein
MPGEEAVLSRTDALQDGSQLLLGGLPEGDADDLDELLPVNEVPEVTDVANQLVTRVHV